MRNEYLEQLRSQPGFSGLVERWEREENPDIGFEVVVAAELIGERISLNYEVSVNPENQKTVDFQFNFVDIGCNLELVRIGLNDTLASIRETCESSGFILASDNQNEDLRTAAQIIKLQWGMLEKVGKFPEATENSVYIIVVDCTNVHAGMFDCHDVAIAMFGRPYDPI